MKVLVAAVTVLVAVCGAALPAKATFPGVSGRIVFVGHEPGRPSDHSIYSVLSNGTRLVRLTSNPAGAGDFVPLWSPEGTRVAFTRFQSGVDTVYVVNETGHNLRRIHEGTLVGWSANSSKLVLRLTDGTLAEIGLDRSAFRTLPVRIPLVTLGLALSPDGRTIAYVEPGPIPTCGCSGSAPSDNKLWLVAMDGTHRPRLLLDETEFSQPSWSADGKTIFGIRAKPEAGGVMSVSVATKSETLVVPVAQWAAGSPDGARVVYSANGDIWTIGVDSTRPLHVTALPGDESMPDWQPFRPLPQA